MPYWMTSGLRKLPKSSRPAMKRILIQESGVLILYKQPGISTYDLIRELKRRFSFRKIGHTGTLDPFAQGVVLVCINQAVKAARFLLSGSKTYCVKLLFWRRTDTFDSEGRSIEEKARFPLDRDKIEEILTSFLGEQEQLCPPYAAAKYKGKPLYYYARRGIEVELPSRPITVHAVSLLSFDQDGAQLRVTVSPGTYIRRLVDDIGRAAGCGAYACALTREKNSGFSLELAVPPDELQTREQLLSHLLPLRRALKKLPEVRLTGEQEHKLGNGLSVPFTGEADEETEYVKLITPDDRLMGIGKVIKIVWANNDSPILKPERLVFV